MSLLPLTHPPSGGALSSHRQQVVGHNSSITCNFVATLEEVFTHTCYFSVISENMLGFSDVISNNPTTVNAQNVCERHFVPVNLNTGSELCQRCLGRVTVMFCQLPDEQRRAHAPTHTHAT